MINNRARCEGDYQECEYVMLVMFEIATKLSSDKREIDVIDLLFDVRLVAAYTSQSLKNSPFSSSIAFTLCKISLTDESLVTKTTVQGRLPAHLSVISAPWFQNRVKYNQSVNTQDLKIQISSPKYDV